MWPYRRVGAGGRGTGCGGESGGTLALLILSHGLAFADRLNISRSGSLASFLLCVLPLVSCLRLMSPCPLRCERRLACTNFPLCCHRRTDVFQIFHVRTASVAPSLL